MAETEKGQVFAAAISEIDRQIEELRGIREALIRLGANPPGGKYPVSPSLTGSAVVTGDPLAAVREQEFAGMSWTQAARVFLQRIGRNEKTPMIIAALKKGGVDVGGKNPMSGLYTALARHSAFVRLGKNYWDLAERRPDLMHGKTKRPPEKTAKLRRKRKLKRLREAVQAGTETRKAAS